MKVELISYTKDAEAICGEAAAICTNSKNIQRALAHATTAGHTSVLEHAVYTFRVEGISRASLAQLTRHRLASYDVQSQRYVRIGEETELVIPKTIEESTYGDIVRSTMRYLISLYQRLIDEGIPCEDARYVTPQAVTTELIVSMNARELLHFFSLRCCNRAQWEIRELADRMLRLCRRTAPEIFRKAGPGCVADRCPEAKPCGHPRRAEEWDD